jgi:pimeloyl-ACP methyl ester carboxylesterase
VQTCGWVKRLERKNWEASTPPLSRNTTSLPIGKDDGLKALYPSAEKLRTGLPGLLGTLEIDNVGHWVQHEASAEVCDQLVSFLRTINPG